MSTVDDVLNEFIDYDADVDDLDRIVEGNQSGAEGQSGDEGTRSDEAEEERPRENTVKVEPKKTRVVKNPRITLNPARLTGPRGVQVIKDHFSDFKFKGKGHEKEDLDHIMKKLEHWAHRLYPKFTFDDCLEKIEHLGSKKLVSTHVRMIHLNMLNDVPCNDVDSDEDVVGANTVDVPEKDDFDLLLEQQIALARSTPGPNTPRSNATTPFGNRNADFDRIALNAIDEDMPSKETFTEVSKSPSLSEVQKERMLRNRQLAEERRKARLKNNTEIVTASINEQNKENESNVNNVIDIHQENDEIVQKLVNIDRVNQDNERVIDVDKEFESNRNNIRETDNNALNSILDVDKINELNDGMDIDVDKENEDMTNEVMDIDKEIESDLTSIINVDEESSGNGITNINSICERNTISVTNIHKENEASFHNVIDLDGEDDSNHRTNQLNEVILINDEFVPLGLTNSKTSEICIDDDKQPRINGDDVIEFNDGSEGEIDDL